MARVPKSLVIKKMPRASVRGALLNASARKAIVARARSASTSKIVIRLRRSDTATGSGHIKIATKGRVG
jgi:hypothetical protein